MKTLIAAFLCTGMLVAAHAATNTGAAVSASPPVSAAPVAAKPATPQERMKVCNRDAGDKNLAGDARKSYMSDCLKAH